MAEVILSGLLVDDGGEVCTCGFQYGLTTAYGSVTGTQLLSTGQALSQTISGLLLLAGTVYHYRAFATNTSGTAYGADSSFLTLSGSGWIPLPNFAPVVATLEADEIGDSAVKLNGYLEDDHGFICMVWFEWGSDRNYGQRTNPQYIASSPIAFEQFIGGLHPERAYHYRAVAQNSAGIGYGADKVFVTGTPLGPIHSIGGDGALLILMDDFG